MKAKKDTLTMERLVDFFTQAGRLKKIKRRGAMLYGKKEDEVESSAEHSYRMVLMTWVLGQHKKGLDINRAVKMAIVHDLCEVYAGDITPYDGLLPKDEGERYEFVRTWPGLNTEEKRKRFLETHEKEKRGLERLVVKLNEELRGEIMDLWEDFEKCVSREAKFVRQVDRAENLLQAEEYYEEDSNFPTKPWWMHAREAVDDPVVLKFMNALEDKEMKMRSRRGDLEI